MSKVDYKSLVMSQGKMYALAQVLDVGRGMDAYASPKSWLGWLLQKLGDNKVLMPGDVERFPYIQEHVFDAPASGADDAAALTIFSYARLASWLEHGPPVSRAPLQASSEDHHVEAQQPSAVPPRRLFGWSKPCAQGGIVCDLPNHVCQINGPLRLCCREDQYIDDGFCKDKHIPAGSAGSLWMGDRRGNQIAGYAGGSMCEGDFDGDGSLDTALGSIGMSGEGGPARLPRAGSVQVFSHNHLIDGAAGKDAPLELTAPTGDVSPIARFGETLAVLDFNLDGIEDLVVAAPSFSNWQVGNFGTSPFRGEAGGDDGNDGSPTDFRNFGRVYVFLGRKGLGLDIQSPITLRTPEGLAERFLRFGATLSVGDIDGDSKADLLVGCETATWDGRVLGFASAASRTAGTTLGVEAAAFDLQGFDQVWSGVSPTDEDAQKKARGGGAAGASIAVVKDLLLVGAPYGRKAVDDTYGDKCEAWGRRCTLVGLVYGFRLAKGTPLPTDATDAAFVLKGDLPMGRLGSAIAVSQSSVRGEPLVAIAQAGADSKQNANDVMGAVHLLDYATLNRLANTPNSSAFISEAGGRLTIRGTDYKARFGTSLRFADLTGDGHDDLVIGAPLGMSDAGWGKHFPETGRAFVWDGAKLPTGTTDQGTAFWSATSQVQAGTKEPRFTTGRFGSSFALATTKDWQRGPCLVVGVPHASRITYTGIVSKTEHVELAELAGAAEMHCIAPPDSPREMAAGAAKERDAFERL